MNYEITGQETPAELVKMLAHTRLFAMMMFRQKARVLRCKEKQPGLIQRARTEHQRAEAIDLSQTIDEFLLQRDFEEIELGRWLISLCHAMDGKVSNEAIFDVINTNRVDRSGELVDKYGTSASKIIFVLDLENSATKDDSGWYWETKPLKWCHTEAFMHELKTNQKLDRIVHDGANEFFNGIFGEYRERSVIERMTGVST